MVSIETPAHWLEPRASGGFCFNRFTVKFRDGSSPANNKTPQFNCKTAPIATRLDNHKKWGPKYSPAIVRKIFIRIRMVDTDVAFFR